MGLLPENLFSKLVAATRTNPETFATQLRQLFAAMRDGGFFGFEKVPCFDGGLFDDDEVLTLDREGLSVLHRVGRLDWDSIEPSILGTLFERSIDPSKRAQLGAHYTSREDILAIVEPVLMAPLRRRWAEVREQAEKLAEKRNAATGGQVTRINNDLSRLLSRFAEEIASVRVLDPACGSGNFLSVSVQNLPNSSGLPAPTINSSASCTRGRTNCGHAGWEPGWAWATIFAAHPRRASRHSRSRGRWGKNRKAIRESRRLPRPPAASTN